MHTHTVANWIAAKTGSAVPQETVLPEVALAPSSVAKGATVAGVGVNDKVAPSQQGPGVLGGDAAADVELIAELLPALFPDEVFGADGISSPEALFNFFLVLCDNLKRFALSGALDEAEVGRALAERMDELKDQVIDLQDEIQRAVEELKKAEASARKAGVVNLTMAWAGVIAAVIGAALTAGAGTPLLVAAVAGATCAGVNASMQSAAFANPDDLATRDSYQRGMKGLMALELILGVGAPGVAAFKTTAGAKALLKASDEAADDAAMEAYKAAAKNLPDQDLHTVTDLAPSPGFREAMKPKEALADMTDDVAAKQLPLKAKQEKPPSAIDRQSQNEAAKLKERAAALDKSDPDVSLDDAFKKQRDILKTKAEDMDYNMERFAAVIEAIQIVGQMAASAVNIKSRLRITDSQLHLMSLKADASSAENALAHVEQNRSLTNQRRSDLRAVDVDLLNAQLDHIAQDREVGLSIAEWRRF